MYPDVVSFVYDNFFGHNIRRKKHGVGMDVTFLNGALYSANVARRIIGDNAFSFYDRAQLYRSLD